MKAVIICEDHVLDEYILKPIVDEVFRECGRAARVVVASHPRIRGKGDFFKSQTLTEVVANYRWQADVFFLIVDSDCDPNLPSALDHIRRTINFGGRKAIFCIAKEEVEVWPLALHRDQLGAPFDVVRADCHPKNSYFIPFIDSRRWGAGPGKGRRAAMELLRVRWDSLKTLCPEVRHLLDDVKTWLDAGS